MLDQKAVFESLEENGVSFFIGVPDSYLNDFCNYALSRCGDRNLIAANEGNAVALAAGHYLATKEIPLVYMQNSGMGNAINPLVSLVDQNVYAVPMLLMIGWRGQGNTETDHPQHRLQGEITTTMLEMMHIPYAIVEDDEGSFLHVVKEAVQFCRENRRPYGLIVPKGVMSSSDKPNIVERSYPMSRERAIEVVLNRMPRDTVYSATTGRTTRELFFLRRRRAESMKNDFLNVGAMGHASSVALGIALARPEKHVVVLDGDAAAIMHMGALTMVSERNVPNYLHIVLNNGVHESVGGQPSAGYQIDFTGIAEACGYRTVGQPVTTEEELISAIGALLDCGKASFIDCRIHKGMDRNLPPIVFNHREAVDCLIDELNECPAVL